MPGDRLLKTRDWGPDRRERVGVVIGNIALPTDSSSNIAREILGRTFDERSPAHRDMSEEPGNTHPLNRYVAGLPAGVMAKALGLGGGSFTLDAACASSLYALKLASDDLIAGRADAMVAGGLSPHQLSLHANGVLPAARAIPIGAAARRSTARRTVSWWERAPAWWYSNGSRTR